MNNFSDVHEGFIDSPCLWQNTPPILSLSAFSSAVKRRSFTRMQPQQQYQSLRDVSGCNTSAVAIVPVPGPLLSAYTDLNDDSRSNTDTASETSASAYDCTDESTTCDRRRSRRCSSSSKRPSTSYHGGRRREEPPAVFSSLAEKKAWERKRLKKDNHNTSKLVIQCWMMKLSKNSAVCGVETGDADTCLYSRSLKVISQKLY